MLKLRFGALTARQARNLRHWAMELVVVVVGVMLALWASEWVVSQREARLHDETLEQIDAAIERTLAVSAARVATADCLRSRIGELDAALLVSEGEWEAMPLTGLPEEMTRSLYFPITFLADGVEVPVSLFELAEDNGTMAALSPEDRSYYQAVRQELIWINENWRNGWTNVAPLALLGRDGYFDAAARFDMRRLLAAFDMENHISVTRARSLARLVEQRGIAPGALREEVFADRFSAARQRLGSCVTQVDLVTLEPIEPAVPGS
ncbi:MAG: hypothetical protein ACQRW7_00925 [Caulobacterales bacterium]|uniref:hypothetical protein n=1 Tax=Glycocaulis sp. TaxID=1969725 RepID=UPI003F9FB794